MSVNSGCSVYRLPARAGPPGRTRFVATALTGSWRLAFDRRDGDPFISEGEALVPSAAAHERRVMQPSSDSKEYLASRAEYLASRAEYLSSDTSAGHAVGGLLMLQPNTPPPPHQMQPQPMHPLMHQAVPVPHASVPQPLAQAAAYPAPMQAMVHSVGPAHRLPQMGIASPHMHPQMVPHPCAAHPAAWPSKRPVDMIHVRRPASRLPPPAPHAPGPPSSHRAPFSVAWRAAFRDPSTPA